MRGIHISLFIAIGIFVASHMSTDTKMSPNIKKTGMGTLAVIAVLYVIFGVF